MEQELSYIIYDRDSGRILGSHRSIDGSTGAAQALTPEQVLADSGLLHDARRLAGGAAVIEADPATLNLPNGLRVDPARKALVQRGRIELRADRPEIAGDGKDKAQLTIRVLHADGSLDTSYQGRIKVSTERGRLDAKGGLVEVKGGQGKVALRSVDESLDAVRLRAADLNHEYAPGACTLAFV